MIDAHQHFWIYAPTTHPWIDDSMSALRRDFLPADLEPLLHANGFDGCVAVQAVQSEAETRWLLDLADRHPFMRGVVGWVDLCALDVGDRIASLAAYSKLRGVRHVVQSEANDRFVLRADFRRGIAELAPRGLAYDLLVYPRQIPAATELAHEFPNQRFVLDHLGKPDVKGDGRASWLQSFRELAALPNVWCKLSGLATEADWARWKPADLQPYLDSALDAFGASRLMIGSDWPVSTLAGDYSTVTGVVVDWTSSLSQAERGRILGENAERFYRL